MIDRHYSNAKSGCILAHCAHTFNCILITTVSIFGAFYNKASSKTALGNTVIGVLIIFNK